MSNNIFNPMEIDAVGEIMNISLGSSATAVSNMLDHRVDITTPTVSVVNAEDFSLGTLEPAIGVEIKYVSGLAGSNIMLLKMSDVKVIVDILMGMEMPEEEFELNELTLSAVCEVMNQMMGAASTALSDFLGRMVNISTPQTFDVDDLDALKRDRLPVSSGPIIVVRFALSIEGTLQSEFMNVMSVDLARELVAGFGLGDDDAPAMPEPEPAPQESGKTLTQEEIERMMAGAAAPEPEAPKAAQPQAQQAPPYAPPGGGMAPGGTVPPYYPPYPYTPGQMPEGAAGMPYPPMYYMPPYGWPGAAGMQPQQQQPPEPKVIQTQAMPMPNLEGEPGLNGEQAQNLDLILSVPLEVSVEIGRTRKKVEDILALSKGSLVVLDKLAGDQVDLYVNGKCIARGDVVVIDDNFGIRISEILRKPELSDLT